MNFEIVFIGLCAKLMKIFICICYPKVSHALMRGFYVNDFYSFPIYVLLFLYLEFDLCRTQCYNEIII